MKAREAGSAVPWRIALLRGVNVGGNKKVSMSDLRTMIADLRFADARTLLQSGNLVFRADARKTTDQLERLLESETPERLGLSADFMVRTPEDWSAVVAGNPFEEEARRDPGHLLVLFMKDAPGPSKVKALQSAIVGREVVQAKGRHAYFVYPDGVGRSRLTHALIEKTLGVRGTARNWNTVMKLGALVRS